MPTAKTKHRLIHRIIMAPRYRFILFDVAGYGFAIRRRARLLHTARIIIQAQRLQANNRESYLPKWAPVSVSSIYWGRFVPLLWASPELALAAKS